MEELSNEDIEIQENEDAELAELAADVALAEHMLETAKERYSERQTKVAARRQSIANKPRLKRTKADLEDSDVEVNPSSKARRISLHNDGTDGYSDADVLRTPPLKSLAFTCITKTYDVQDDQEEEEKNRRRSHTKSTQRKRKILTSDVSDDEDADHAHLTRKIAVDGIKVESAQAIVKLIRSDSTDEFLSQKLRVGIKGDEVPFVIGLTHALNHAPTLRRVLTYYAGRWPDDRKSRYVETLVKDGYLFSPKKKIGILALFNALEIKNPDPQLILLFKKVDVGFDAFVRSLYDLARESIMGFLSTYLRMPMDARLVTLESLLMYNKDYWFQFVRQEGEILNLISHICRLSGIEPTVSYFRHMRSKFVEDLIKEGNNGRVSVENAARQAIAFAGDAFEDKGDMVLALSKWPAVGRRVTEILKIWRCVQNYASTEQNLVEEPKCRPILHQHQSVSRVFLIKSQADLDVFARSFVGITTYVYVLPNKHPRRITDIPGLIAFKSPGKGVAAFLPQEVPDEIFDGLFRAIAKAMIATKAIKVLRHIFSKRLELNPQFLEVVAAMNTISGGRSNEAVSNWSYGLRFCPIAREEWVTESLSADQEYHLAYYMEIMEIAIQKIGLGNLRVIT